jgi:kynurenine formamidase
MRLRVVLSATLFALGCAAPPPHSGLDLSRVEVIDLTHAFNAETIYWPTEQPFQHERTSWGVNDKGYFYSSYSYAAAEHLGTHADAPIHFAEGRRTLDAVPIRQWIGQGVVLDVAAACDNDPDYVVSDSDIQAHETEHGPIPPGALVLVRTGWSRFWPDAKRYMGDDTPGATDNLHFPGVGEDAARILAARRVSAVGIDTASIDHGPSSDFPSHRILAAENIPLLENLTGLEQLPPRGAWIIALPMKIGGGSGGPLRIVALL